MDIGSLTGTLAIEDTLSGSLTTAAANVQTFGEKVDGLSAHAEPGMQKIADATKNVGTEADRSSTMLSGMANQLAGMFTIGAVIAFGREVLAAGDHIQKMADQASLGTDEVQKLMYIAGQSGTSIESLVGQVQNLQQRLGDESSGAAGAMAKLGISADAFNKLDTYAQFTLLAEGVRGITDPTEQASLAAELFGKTWKEILPAIKSGMEETGNQASIMSGSELVQSLDRVGDAMTRAKGQAITWGGTLVLAIEGAGFAFGDFLSRFNTKHWGESTSEILKMAGALNDPSGLHGALSNVQPPMLAVNAGIAALKMPTEAASRITADLTEKFNRNAEAAKEAEKALIALKAQVALIEGTTENTRLKIVSLGDALLTVGERARVPMLDPYIESLGRASEALRRADEATMKLFQDSYEAAQAQDAVNASLGVVTPAIEGMTGSVNTGSEAMQRMTEVATGLTIGMRSAGQAAEDTRTASFERAEEAWRQFIAVGVNANPTTVPIGGTIPFETRDSGGAVSAGRPYMVGTGAQPELFIPSSSGTMIPNATMSGSTTTIINITQPLGTPDTIASAVSEALETRRRRMGGRQPLS